MFMKKLAVAAALMLCAFGASASNFRAADQVYVPIAGHAVGQSGTFITDAFIANLSDESVDVSVIYVPIGANEGANEPRLLEELRQKITLRAYERKEYLDIFVSTLGKTAESEPLGMLVFNGCKANANCGPETQDDEGYSANFRPISVQTRIYQVDATPGNTGQLFTGIPWYNFVSELQSNAELDMVFLTGLTHNGSVGQAGTYRTNIGVVNASEYSKTDIVFRLYQGTLNDVDKKIEAVRSLGPLGNQQYQFQELFPGFSGTNFFVTVEQRNSQEVGGTVVVPDSCERGCPAFLAYASVLDNVSGDAITMEAQYLKEMDPAALEILYPLGAGKTKHPRFLRR